MLRGECNVQRSHLHIDSFNSKPCVGLCYAQHGRVCLQEFQECWAEYDDGSGTIAPDQLQSLLIRTDPPLGLGRMATGRDVLRFVFNLDIPLVNGRVPFHRTVYELVRNVSETQIPEVPLDILTSKLQLHMYLLAFSCALLEIVAMVTFLQSK